jgi:hypothetical protein
MSHKRLIAPPSRPASAWFRGYWAMRQPATAILLIAIVVCVALRTAHSGWGLVGPVPDPDKSVPYGIAVNPTDYLSYSSWAQQARDGAWTFSDLYTTTPHAAIYFNPFFLIVGWLSRIFSVRPELVLNVLIFPALILFVYSLNAASRRLGFGRLTTFCVLCLCFGGGGVTWIRRIVALVGLENTLHINAFANAFWDHPDWYYAELFPEVTFNISGFHSMSLALLAVVAFWLIRYDDPAQRFSRWDAVALIGVAAFLVALRPYEPVVLLAAYAAYLPCTWLDRSERFSGAFKRRAGLFGCLVVAMAPFLAYDLWLTHQPVWQEFSRKSTDIAGGADWAGAFLVLWLLATIGVPLLGPRALTGPWALLVIWSAIFAVILLILHSGYTKLCGGCTIPLSLLAGVAIEHGLGRLRARPQRALAAVVLACFALGSSTGLLIRIAKAPADRVSGELLAAIDAMRRDSNSRAPAVLTDPGTARYLPGFGGLRVYCGDWGLTDDIEVKRMALARFGLGSPVDPSQPPAEESMRAAVTDLRQQIRENAFSFLLIHRGYASPEVQASEIAIERRFPQNIVYKGKDYRGIKLGRETPSTTSPAIGSTSLPSSESKGQRAREEKVERK